MAFTRISLMSPRPGAVSVLTDLRREGLKLGLITNCTPETPAMWSESILSGWFDESLLSSKVGLKKPDVRIYELPCSNLGVDPDQCMYVGDGDDDELHGALQAGLHPVRVPCYFTEGSQPAAVAPVDWSGATVNSLGEITGLLQ